MGEKNMFEKMSNIFFYIYFFVSKSSETHAEEILTSVLLEGGGGVCRSLTKINPISRML